MPFVTCSKCKCAYEVDEADNGKECECPCGHEFRIEFAPAIPEAKKSGEPTVKKGTMHQLVSCQKCDSSYAIASEIDAKGTHCPYCDHVYGTPVDPKDKQECQNDVTTRNAGYSSSSNNDGLFAIIAILIVVTCLLIIPGCLMDSIMDVGNAFLTGISCFFLVGLFFTIRFFENKIAYIACVCGIICALWFFGFFLDFVFSKMKSSSKGIGDTLTTEKKRLIRVFNGLKFCENVLFKLSVASCQVFHNETK